MITIVYVISRVSHSKLFEWTATLLDQKKYRLVFILMHEQETGFEEFLRKENFTVYRIKLVSRRHVLRGAWKIRSILRREKADVVHTHLFEAGVAGQIGGWLARTKRRIHTRHDAMIHHDYHPQAVKYDRLTNRLATNIIAISNNVREILTTLEHVPEEKIVIIHHGFVLDAYNQVPDDRIDAVRKKYLNDHVSGPVIGVVSRFIEWKGIQHIIPAFKKLLEKFPGAKLLLANAQGPYERELLALLDELPEDSYRRILFEDDIAALYKLMNVFVHVPVDQRSEAFGQVYIEAMAAGVPSVITVSGIVPESVRDGIEAVVVPYRDSDAIFLAIDHLLTDPAFAERIAASAMECVYREFTIGKMIQELEHLYDNK